MKNFFSYRQIEKIPKATLPSNRHQGMFRIPGNFRTYYSMSENRVLAFKGFHPNLQSYRDLLLSCLSRTTQTTLFDDLLFLEGKLPGLLTLEEAQAELEKGQEFISHFNKGLGRGPRVAKPVGIFELEALNRDQVIKSAEAILKGERKRRYLRILGHHRIAVLISTTQKLPLRLKYISFLQDSKITRSYLRKNPLNIEKAWTSIFSTSKTAFELGYSLASPLDRVHGSCLDLQNLTLYGEICDLDSIHRMSDFSWGRNSDQFRVSLIESLSRVLEHFGFVKESNRALSHGLIYEGLFSERISPQEILRRLKPFLS